VSNDSSLYFGSDDQNQQHEVSNVQRNTALRCEYAKVAVTARFLLLPSGRAPQISARIDLSETFDLVDEDVKHSESVHAVAHEAK
jgi:hypothetical protein